MQLIRLLSRYSKQYWPAILAVVVLQLITTLATLYLPDLNAAIIDKGVSQGDVGYIWRTGGIMLLVAFVQFLAAVAAFWFASRTAMRTGRDIREAVFSHVSIFSAEDMQHFGTPSLITRGTNDVQQIQMTYLLFLNFMVNAPIMAIGGIIMAVRQDAGMSWLVAVAVITLAVVVGIIAALLMPLFRTMQERLDAINGVLREQIAGIRVIRAFGREEFESQRFTEANDRITRVSLNIGRVFVTMFPVIMLILNLATAAVLWFGGHRVDEGLVEVGALTAFMQYLMQILMAVMMATFMLMMLPRAIVCSRRVAEVLNHDPQIIEPHHPEAPATRGGDLEFRDVTFTYPGADAPVLKRVSFTARPDIVERVSMVPQKPWLFSGTVASNLRMGNPDATDEELWNALRAAQADFVADLDMEISQGGTNVSGGQRQRLSIARMLVAQPDVFLFDDSFSALDASTDARVRAAMTEYTAGKVVIVVGQRVASISGADQILVMEAGEIVARGTHEELLESSQTYREIEQSQKAVQA